MSNNQNAAANQSVLNTLLLVSVLVTFVLIYIATSAGLRGTDQYQYAADAESIRDNQPALTNLFFPAKIVRNQAVDKNSNYFPHNGPLLYITGKTAGIAAGEANHPFHVQDTWIFLNCVFHLITAFAIFYIARALTSQSAATAATVLYFISPIAFWQTSNVLQEMFYSALVSLCLLCYYFRGNPLTTVLLPLCYFIGALSHPIFVLTGFLHGVSLIIMALVHKNRTIVPAGVLTLIAVYCALVFSAQWFPTQFQPGLKEIIVSAIPNYSNMVYHFQVVPPEITTELLFDKFIAAANKHFFSLKNAPFFIFTNIAGFSLLFLLYQCLVRRAIRLYLLAPLAILFGAYIGIIVLQQNHARFQQIIAPATFLVIAFVIHRISFAITKPVVLITCVLLATDAMYANYLRKQAVFQSQAITELRDQISTLTKTDARLLSVDIFAHGALAYALRPKDVLTVSTRLMQTTSIKSAIDLYKPEYILMKGDQEHLFDNQLSLITEMDNQHFGRIKLFQY